MSEQTRRLLDRLHSRLRRTVRRMTWARAAFGGAVVIGVAAAVWLVAAAVEAGFWLDTTPRSVLIGAAGAATLGVALFVLARPVGQLIGLLRRPSDEEVARRIGKRYPEVSDRLVNMLQLAEGRGSHAPAPMIDTAVQRLGEQVEPVPFEEVETFDGARKAARIASLPVIGVLAFLLVAPTTFLDASERLLAPTTHFQRPAPFTLDVYPGDVRLVRGDSLAVSIRATGEAPSTLSLRLRPEGDGPAETVSLRADSTGVFRHTVPGLRQSVSYRAASGRVASAWYEATVQARPLVQQLQLRVVPPRYTGLPARSLDANLGDVTGLPGTTVQLDATLGGPAVDSAAVVFDDGRRTALSVDDGTASGSFRLTREGRYSLWLRSATGVSNRDPIRYSISLRADARPSVTFLAPEPDANLGEDLAAQLRLRLSDDYGFSRMRLSYRLAEQSFGSGQSEFSSMPIPLSTPGSVDQEVVYDWLLAQDAGLDLVPGDVVEYYVTVWDNDAFAGTKSARTATQRLRLASITEKYKQLDEEQEDAESQMNNLRDQADEVSEQFDELRRELRRKQDADWEDRRQIEQLQKKQESLEKGVENLSKQIEEMTQKMQRDDLVSPETAKKFEELQRVAEEINSPELQDALKKLQESMQNLDLRQMQKAMEDFEFNEEQYRQRLDRTIELFKQLRRQQKVEEISRRMDELGQTEQRLAEQTAERMDEKPEDDPAEEEATGEDSTGEEATGDDAADADEAEETESEEPTEAESGKTESGKTESGQLPSEDSQTGEPNAEESPTGERPSGEAPSEKSPSNEDLAREQDRARERMKELLQEMQKLSQEMKEEQAGGSQQMQQMQQQMQQKELPEQMKENSRQLRDGQLQDAQDGQQQMQQQLQQMSQQMQQMQQSMSGQQQSVNLAGLYAVFDNTLRLSQTQESLRGTVRDLSANSPTLRNYAQEQEQIKTGLLAVSDSLQSLAKKIPQMTREVQKHTGEAIRAMDGATTALSERNAARASGQQKESMMHMNELARLLAELLEAIQNQQQGGGGGQQSMQQMLQQMQQMTGQQQKLNKQIQQFLNDVQGNRLSNDQQKRLQQLAEQQARIKKQLDELGKGSGMRDDLLGDLDKIAEQMEETIRELQQGRQDPRTVERQRQILTRMLDAQRSLQTQGKENRREGRSSDDELNREPPGELTPKEQAEKLRRDLIRALESGYAPDYEKLIKRYFELLQQQKDERGR